MDNKTIKKCHDIIDRRLSLLREIYHEAKRSYQDTGYDRYYKAMEKIDEEIDELEIFKECGQPVIQHLEQENQRLREKMSRLREMYSEITEDDFTSPRVDSLLKFIKGNI